MDTKQPTRRVYAAELKSRTGWSDSWLREKERRGAIPKGRKDPGGKMKWWTDAEADAIVSGATAPTERAAAA
jgi:hypothetical protein